MDMDDTRETVAELTVYYKGQPLTRLIFDNQDTGDKVVQAITQLLDKKGKKDFSFSGEIKTVYTPETMMFELFDYIDGKVEPKGTLLDIMKAIDGHN